MTGAERVAVPMGRTLVRPDPAAPDRYQVFACHAHAFTVLALDGVHPSQMQCRLPVSASAICGAVARPLDAPAGPDDFPVTVVVARRGREVEWIKRRRT